jgi:hypothetical protein
VGGGDQSLLLGRAREEAGALRVERAEAAAIEAAGRESAKARRDRLTMGVFLLTGDPRLNEEKL